MKTFKSFEVEQEPSQPERNTRKPMETWDRLKFLILFLLVWLGFVAVYTTNNPLESVATAARLAASNEWWLTLLIFAELIRQAHYIVAEHNEAWNEFFDKNVVAKLNGVSSGWDDWTRYRVSRVGKWLLVIALVSVVAAAHYHVSPFVAPFLIPSAIISAMPTLLQYLLLILVVVMQFVAIFWFMSKGGVDVYFPGDIKTRFSDVWGQDNVLDKVKENIIYLKDPELIEAHGGYVPGGILLWGPPGTGKTLIAEAVAGETQNPFVFVDPGAFTNMFFGVGILKVKSLFRKLRKLALRYGGVVVFFDEADSLGSRGNLAGAGGQYGSQSNPIISSSLGSDSCHGTNYMSQAASHSLFMGTLRKNLEVNAQGSDSRGGVLRYVFPGGAGMGMGGMDGTLQALLTELSGLKKPRGFMNRVVRRALGLPPKNPPKYRILVMMATNMPQSLDEALLRPGRIDRIYKVGYPSKDGRVRTYKGYLSKVNHSLTESEIDRLATITPYATGAVIKDLVNEALINTIRAGRETIVWSDIIKAKQLKQLGPPEDVEYIERERHAVAIHEACHALAAVKLRKHMSIDIATIEKGGNYLGMVSNVPPEDRFTSWRSEYETDIMVGLASLAGERLFYSGDNSSGVSSDLENATALAALMEGIWGMGSTIFSQSASQALGFGGEPGAQHGRKGVADEARPRGLGDRIEAKLEGLYRDVFKLLEDHRASVLAIAHALETHKTVTGEDVEAIVACRRGPIIDGSVYGDLQFQRELEEYHRAAQEAHATHSEVGIELPRARKIPLALKAAGGVKGSAVAFSPKEEDR